ncbi:hypothetical protein BH10BAC2_BH10BAC2_23460 [soil metagenome]
MEYNILEHGDALEKVACNFIRSHFSNYELVWKSYIGNKGNNKKADIPNYNDEKRREDFSEYSYTVFESAFVMYKIVKSKILSNSITTIDQYIEFNKSFISFFAHLGRINDNILNATNELDKNYYSILGDKLDYLYKARHVVIHGKTIPITQDELGLVQIPQFYTDSSNIFGWTKIKVWEEAQLATKNYAEDVVEEYYNDLIHIINNAYGYFYDVIMKELKAKIKFEYNLNIKEPVNVYNIQLPIFSSNKL